MKDSMTFATAIINLAVAITNLATVIIVSKKKGKENEKEPPSK